MAAKWRSRFFLFFFQKSRVSFCLLTRRKTRLFAAASDRIAFISHQNKKKEKIIFWKCCGTVPEFCLQESWVICLVDEFQLRNYYSARIGLLLIKSASMKRFKQNWQKLMVVWKALFQRVTTTPWSQKLKKWSQPIFMQMKEQVWFCTYSRWRFSS